MFIKTNTFCELVATYVACEGSYAKVSDILVVAHGCFPLGEKTAKSTLQHQTFEYVNYNMSHSALRRASRTLNLESGCESYDAVSNTVPSSLLQFIQLHEYLAIDNGGYVCMKRLCPLCG